MKKYCIYYSVYDSDGEYKKSLIRIKEIQKSPIEAWDLVITKGSILITEEETFEYFKTVEGEDYSFETELYISEVDYIFEAENDEEAKLIFEVYDG